MKIVRMFAAASLVVASLGVATVADAQTYGGNDRTYNQNHRNDGDRRDQRNDRGNRYENDRGRHNGWNNHRRCHTEWRHHHRVRICR
ncbi:MAG: hypothetical protein JWN66_4816 [Sphingomonas bacterium]|uniref:hypothetical protein n=1 Tax=Sphingomonas bacterium TaxID=1895847 RepID=UPI0026034EAE|nr:hypothetical protein [Sphingomonas bacterium]MDB5707700.1 hypothetical protein [Sphingomonas bacterium]